MSDITDVLQRRREARLAAQEPKPLSDEEKSQFGIEEPGPSTVPVNGEALKKVAPRRASFLPEVSKPLPQSLDAEKGVLGSVLLSPKRMYEVERIVGESHFCHPAHHVVFQALKELHSHNDPIDLISVTQYLDDQGKLSDAGGAAAVTELFTFVPTAGNLPYYLDILCEKYKARETWKLGMLAAEAALSNHGPGEIDSLLQSFSDRVRSIQNIGKVDAGIEVISFRSIMDFDTKEDGDSVLGHRYLCRGGSALIVGPSGIGKSSLAMQQAIRWAQGQPCFGLGPTGGRRLRCLFIQAENDKGDLAEMMQGVIRGFPLPPGMPLEEFAADMEMQIVFARDTIHTGPDFARCAARLIDRHKPDLVFVDPLLSYVGDDISSQKVASQFLRNTLNPIARNTGIIWMLLHHTGKPSTDPKAKAHWKDHDFSYAAFGSSELVNWARAVMVLRSIGEDRFELRFSKRGKRTGVIEYQDPEVVHDKPAPFTDVVYIQHAKGAICWEQITKPDGIDVPKGNKDGSGQFVTKYSEDALFELVKGIEHGRTPTQYKSIAMEQMGMKERTFWNVWKKLRESDHVFENNRIWFAKTPENIDRYYPKK